MSKVPDRKKLRREYLRQKRAAYVRLVGTVSACTVGSVAFLLLSVGALLLLLTLVFDDGHGRYEPYPLSVALGWTAPFWLTAIVSGIVGRIMWRKAMGHRQTLTRLSYVPPVTSDTLAANEILVRAAEKPVAQSEVLLRAAQQANETPKEELLRVAAKE
jgi:hypothetical protein